MFRLTAAMFLLTKTTQADYIFKTTFTAQYPESFDTFGSAVTVALNGSTLIAASGVPNIVTDPHVEIWRSSNNGQSWSISQSLTCCPIPPAQKVTPFNVAFSDSGKTMLIGKPESTGGTNSDGATLYFDSNGLYLSTTLDLTSQNLPTNGMSVALSGDGTYAFVGAYDTNNTIGYVSYTYIPGSPPIPKFISVTALQPYSLATNTDGSTLVIGLGTKVLVYTAFSYDNSPPTITQTILPTLGETKTFGLSVSLTRDGSILAIGSCGYGVYVYLTSNLATPSQILTLPNVTYFGCNIDLSDDGKRLIVGSQNNISQSNGYVYPYQRSGGVFTLENNQLSPPTVSNSYGGGGVSVVNQALDYGVVLVGGPSSGAGPIGQIAVFDSVPTSSATPTATASASSTSSAIATPSSSNTFSAFSSASSTRTSTATSTATSSMTATMTSSPSASASSSVTSTMTATSTQTLTSTSTSSSSASATATATSTSSSSSSASATATATSTSSSSATASASATATGTNTATGTATSTRTSTPSTTQSMTSTTTATPSTSIIPLAANSTPFIITVSLASTGGVIVLVGLGYFLLSWLRKPPAGPTKALFPVEVTQNSPWHVVSGSGSGPGSGGEVSSLLGAKSVNSYTAVSEGDIGDTYRALSVAEGAGGVKGGASRKQRVISLL
jgi:hypothetical protein